MNKWLRNALIGTGVLVLSACSSLHKSGDPAAVNDANEAYNSQAETSGAGGGGGFGDRSMSHGQLASSRIYYFDYDSTVIHEGDKAAIIANADYLLAHPQSKILLEGHTDPRGSREYNIGLGERRAKAVADLLQSKGVSPSQVRIISYGAEKLAMAGHTESEYEKDRRSVLAYLQQ